MELPNVGENCAEASCKRLDFLPLICGCNKKFCSNHFGEHAYTCLSVQSSTDKVNNPSQIYMCTKENCLKTSLVPIICGKCNKNFCIEHRHIVSCEDENPAKLSAEKKKFEDPVRKFNEAKLKVDEQILGKLTEAKKKSKNVATANKLQIMLIKNKAVGLSTIPGNDRIYFNILCPKKTSDKIFPVFVSKNWSVGHAIDFIADHLKIVNNNNKENQLKLRLFRKELGNIVSQDVSFVIENLLSNNNVYNGEELVLEYVQNDCTKIEV